MLVAKAELIPKLNISSGSIDKINPTRVYIIITISRRFGCLKIRVKKMTKLEATKDIVNIKSNGRKTLGIETSKINVPK